MTQKMRLLSIVVLLLLVSSIKVCDAQVKVSAARNKMQVRNRQKAVSTPPGPAIEVTPVVVGGPPPGVGGPGLSAQAYAGFYCGPDTNEAVMEITTKCNVLPICKFKRVDDGAAGKKLTFDLEDGQGECMRRCDARFNMSEQHCGEGLKCHSFVMGCRCANLNDDDCHPYYND